MERRNFVGFGGIHIAGDAFGSPDDPAVLLLPAFGQSRAYWYGSAQALADAGRYAICVDLRGHGDSGHATDGHYDLGTLAEDLKAILATLQTRAFVVAAGLGAIIAALAAGEGDAHLVSGLALIDVTIWFDADVAKRVREGLVRRTKGFEDSSEMLDAMATLYPSEPRTADPRRLLTAFSKGDDGRLEWRGDPRVLEGTDLLKLQARLKDAVARISTPVTLIRGSLNDTVSGESLRLLQAIIPGAELAEIEGAGHHAATDREDAFNSLLLDFLERRAPRRPLTYRGGSEPRLLRDALGCFGTGVTIVTTVNGNGAPIGLTANSFTSVSLDPPLILFSLAKVSANLDCFKSAGHFAVNVLQIGQQPVANRFAQRDIARFDSVDWSFRDDKGSPIITNSLASFDCETYAVHDGGDHLIFIGQVMRAWFEPHRDPLLYFRGKYRRLHFA